MGMVTSASAQKPLSTGSWRAFLNRNDSERIVFSYNLQWMNNMPLISVVNADEKIELKDVAISGDSLFAKMPVFESEFRMKIVSKDSVNGIWIKGTSGKNQVIPFAATAKQPYRFKAVKGNAQKNISGKWSVTFASEKGEARDIAVFNQKGNSLTGSVLTPTGDYRYLQGIVTGDSVLLSTFDGVHALLFTGNISQQTITGSFYSSLNNKKAWTAFRNDTATLPDLAAMYLKDTADNQLHFRFPDLNGNMVSINDPQFKNKVVVIQLMGSWCPNCMDETAFLSDWYKKNRSRGVEVIGLAYEYTTDFERSKKSLGKFQQRFAIDYPLLITGVSVADSLKTEKTLPQFTPIKSFPTTIIIDKQGQVRKIETDFAGPGTGVYYDQFKKEFESTVDTLLSE